MARWNQTVLLLCCVFCWSSDLVAGCSPQGPENCMFQTNINLARETSDSTWCSWKGDGNWSNFNLNLYTWNQFPGLSKTKVTGRLTSHTSCSTKGRGFCFYFQYFFKAADEMDLNVYVQNVDSQSEQKVWSASSGGFWNDFQQAYIPISTQFDYAIVFQASRRSTPSESNTKSVYVDDLQFVQSPCPSPPPCFTEGPENCTFQIHTSSNLSYFTACSWTTSGGWHNFYFQTSPWPWFAGLLWDAMSGQLTSRPACSTYGQTHVLMFDFKFDKTDTVNLTVFIQNTKNKDSKTTLWSKSQVPINDKWETASVSVNTDYDFVVVFEATRLSPTTLNKYISVFIDHIRYVATPTSVSTRRLDTSTPAANDVPTSPARVGKNVPENTTTVPTTPDPTAPVPLIAGLASAVVLVSVIVIVLLLLRRRRRQGSPAPRPQADYVFPNAAANVESSPVDEGNYDDMTEILNSRPNIQTSTRSGCQATVGGDSQAAAVQGACNDPIFPSELYSGLDFQRAAPHTYSSWNELKNKKRP